MAVESVSTLPLGGEMPPIALPDPDGVVVEPPAGALLVVFACNHCPYVVHVADALGGRAEQWIADGLGVVAINSNDVTTHPDDRPELMPGFAAEHGWTFPYLVDATQSTALAFGARCTPDIFLFDADQRLAYHGQFDATRPGSGTASGDDLAAAVALVLAGEPVPADGQRPSIGCSIKWLPGNDPT